jgi:hypothetical protein
MEVIQLKNKCDDKPLGGWVTIYNVLKELFITSFSWNNLPNTVNPRYLELMLFDYGCLAFFHDDILGDLVLPAMPYGYLNVYGEPIQVEVHGANGYRKILKNSVDCVLIYNNYIRDTPHARVMDYSKRIYKIERTIDVNVHNQRTARIIQTSKKQELTIKNLLKEVDEYKPEVVVDDEMDIGKLKSVDITTPYVSDKLHELKKQMWNEVLSYIGIENNSSEKNERLAAMEVMVSNGLAIANRNAKLQARQNAAKLINTIFNQSIAVDVNNMAILEVEGGAANE